MKHVRKFLKWAGLSAGMVIAILLIANAWFVWSTGAELATRLQELREAGEPIRLADLAFPAVPADRNADTYYRRASGDLEAIQKELLASYPNTGQPSSPLSPADKDRLEKLFAAYPRLVPLLGQAADAPDYDPRIDMTGSPTHILSPYLKQVQGYRGVYRVLRARAGLLISQERFDEAIAGYLVLLRLTRHWQRDPLLIGYLLTIAGKSAAMDGINDVLRSGTISPASRKALDDELAWHDSLDGLRHALRSERAYSLATIQELPIPDLWITRGFKNALTLGMLDLFDRQLQDAELPANQVMAGRKTPPTVSKWPNPYGTLVSLLETSLGPLRDGAERVRAQDRCVRIVNALQARVPAGSETVPKLADLGLPAEVTIDPFNGEALQVKKLPAGWLVYSVGSNLVDDGGKLEKVVDVGFGPIQSDREMTKP
jgi:hypothetical protein